MAQPGRNEICPCGSGKKYKHCCAQKQTDRSSRLIILLVAGAILAAVLAAYSSSRTDSRSGMVWSPEHGHYHDASGREVSR